MIRLLALSLLVAVGCSKPTPSAPAIPNEMVNGSRTRLLVGQTAWLNLYANASAGRLYARPTISDPKAFTVQGTKTNLNRSDPGPGVGVVITYRFFALRPGTVKISFAHYNHGKRDPKGDINATVIIDQ